MAKHHFALCCTSAAAFLSQHSVRMNEKSFQPRTDDAHQQDSSPTSVHSLFLFIWPKESLVAFCVHDKRVLYFIRMVCVCVLLGYCTSLESGFQCLFSLFGCELSWLWRFTLPGSVKALMKGFLFYMFLRKCSTPSVLQTSWFGSQFTLSPRFHLFATVCVMADLHRFITTAVSTQDVRRDVKRC